MRLIMKNYPRKRVFFFLSLLLFSSCATKLVIPEPVAVPQVDIEDLARYSEAPIHITSQLPVLPAGGTSLNVDKTSLSLFNAGNRFTDWRGKDDYLARVQPLLGKRCVSCHAKRPTNENFRVAPKNVVFDTPAQIRNHAAKIRAVAVLTRTMPLGNSTRMTDAERALLGRWIADGAEIE